MGNDELIPPKRPRVKKQKQKAIGEVIASLNV